MKKRGLRKASVVLMHIILRLLILAYILFPVYWILNSSFIKETALARTPPLFYPIAPFATLSHYRFIITGTASPEETVMLQAMYTASGTFILPGLRNSIIIALLSTFFSLALAVPAAYTFARRTFWGKEALFFVFLAVRLLPSISIAVPVFLLFRRFGLLDRLEGLVLINTAIATPLAIWVLRPYFEALAKDYEEAALVDGCNYIQLMFKIILPIIRPGIIAAAIFVFMLAYGEFIFGLTLTSTLRARPVSVIVVTLAQGLSVSKGMLSAGIVLAFLPPVALAVLFRRYLISGLTQSVIGELK